MVKIKAFWIDVLFSSPAPLFSPFSNPIPSIASDPNFNTFGAAHLAKSLQLLGHQKPGRLHWEALSNHGAVGAVGRSERIVDIRLILLYEPKPITVMNPLILGPWASVLHGFHHHPLRPPHRKLMLF